MRQFSRLFVVLVILLSGTVLAPYAAFPFERFGWQFLAGAYGPDTITIWISGGKGGTLVYTDAQGQITTIVVPPGAVNQDTLLAYTPLPVPTQAHNLQFAGHAFTLEAYQGGNLQPGFGFSQPVIVIIHYSDADVRGMNENNLTLNYWNGSQWVDAATTCTPPSTYDRHPNENWLSVSICHLSEFALGTYRIYLPVILKNR